eukprot:GHRR01032564.1.p1 GENE.GHRR01032564.1~~GHRR01032564.1.p1  ORF type:complete len:114 (-),score=36.57 GHRR01032564.1:116-457(-)
MFKDFYSKHYSSYRQLVWQHSMSTAMLRANFPKGAKELSVSLLQALVLLLFNDADELSYEAIKEQLGVKNERELQRTLLSLSVGKVGGCKALVLCVMYAAGHTYLPNKTCLTV